MILDATDLRLLHFLQQDGRISNQELAEKCKKLRNLAFETQGRRFIHHELGWNYRMTNLQAALGLAQLEKIEYHIKKKREIGNQYNEGLKALKRAKFKFVRTVVGNVPPAKQE